MEKTITHDYEMLVELNQMTNSRWEYNIWKIVSDFKKEHLLYVMKG